MEAVLIIVLIALAFLLLVAELFVIGGVLGTFGAILILTAIGLSFYTYGATAGVLVMVLAGGTAILIVVLGLRFIRRTRTGRQLFLEGAVAKQEGFESADRSLEQYRGRIGVTVSELHPAGLADFDGERITVSTEGGFVEKGVLVKVIDIRYNQVIVQNTTG